LFVIFNNQHPTLGIPNSSKLHNWLVQSIKNESYTLGKLNYTFLTDDELHKINMQFLNHDTYTDIITFDYNQGNMIIGEIYISMDRVKENSEKNKSDFNSELYRIIIHGLLHLMGYKDKTPQDKNEMTAKEDYYLSLLP
jgi:rRNA maturation RNase YbeY